MFEKMKSYDYHKKISVNIHKILRRLLKHITKSRKHKNFSFNSRPYRQVLVLNSFTETKHENTTAFIFALLTPLNLKKKT